ncbi:NADH-quinone oxidoreductase subunit N [Porticoccus sp. Uisw_050_02]|jgi:NADH-quinone oxidoreductase subunit N|uniref:NADH-quinone oxidoreductase subunit N n=1 Tax=Porticoccus sp. Uisw_050_02 TaxID=3230978 RepID=UPI0039ED72A6|tara:strand:- start:546 stop:1961 length:1416 start_codon:yes stop_codon:yes gene_type:complete
MNGSQMQALMPILMLSLTAIVLMIQASIKRDEKATWIITVVGILLALWGAGYARDFSQPVTILLQVDNWGLFFTALVLLASLVTVVLSQDSFSSEGGSKEEYYLLLVLSALGAVILIQSSHMASLLLGMELMGVALYAMIAFPKKGLLPLEAAVKYLVLSGCASAILLFGFALLYAATGELSYKGIGEKAALAYISNPLLVMAGTAMVTAGIAFKLSLVPFHMWTPDVYQGAPTPVTGFLATVSKGAVFVALARIYMDAELHQYESLILALSVLAAFSMLIGNLLALLQEDIKRLLAYSSIAHFGYLLIVLIALTGSEMASEAVTFYLAAYILTTLGAFTVIARVSREDQQKSQISEFEGLFWRNKIQATALTIAMLSFAGIPLTAGFMAKFFVINVAIQGSHWFLLSALVIGSAIGIYYYLRIIFSMSKTSGNDIGFRDRSGDITALLLTVLILMLGSWPQPFIAFAGGL